SVVEVRAAARALAQPTEVLRRDHVPSIQRHPPVLSRRAERVGRRADGDVEVELVLPRPDVGAVAVDHERQIAEQRDGARPFTRRTASYSMRGARRARSIAARSSGGMHGSPPSASKSVTPGTRMKIGSIAMALIAE